MEKNIHFDTLRQYAYSNDKLCSTPLHGAVISFYGQMDSCEMIDEDTEEGRFYAQKGILNIVPYTNPWSWMNRQAAAYTDEIVNVLKEAFCLPDDFPLAVTGENMGGQSALVYMTRGAYAPTVCAAVCPPCDMVCHYEEHPELQRTIYNALYEEPGTFFDELRLISPIHLVHSMPDAQYILFQCEKDQLVPREKHADCFVAKMRENHCVTYEIIPGTGYVSLSDSQRRQFMDAVANAVLAGRDTHTC